MQRVTVFARPFLTDGRPEAIAENLSRSGFAVSKSADREIDPRSTDIVWIQDNLNWFPILRRQLYSLSPGQRPFVLIWHTEPLGLPSDSSFPRARLNARELAKIVLRDPRATDAFTNLSTIIKAKRKGVPDLIVVSTRSRKTFLEEKGIESHFVPLGFYPALGRDMKLKRDIDVLFLGTMTDPRHRKSVKYLRSRGVAIQGLGDWGNPKYWGENRTKLINRARIFVNIQRHPGKLSGHRMILGMSNKAMVLSEPMYDPYPYQPGTHFVSASLTEMPDVIRACLGNDEKREAVVEAGYRLVTEELTMERSVGCIVELMKSRQR